MISDKTKWASKWAEIATEVQRISSKNKRKRFLRNPQVLYSTDDIVIYNNKIVTMPDLPTVLWVD